MVGRSFNLDVQSMQLKRREGLAVGKPVCMNLLLPVSVHLVLQTFAPNAVRLARILIGVQNNIISSDDPRNSYLMEGESNA